MIDGELVLVIRCDGIVLWEPHRGRWEAGLRRLERATQCEPPAGRPLQQVILHKPNYAARERKLCNPNKMSWRVLSDIGKTIIITCVGLRP